MLSKEVWVVIPAFNEERELGRVLKQVKSIAGSVLVVDDASKDDTLAIAKKAGVVVLSNKKNQGKGFTLRRGCDYAIEHGAKIMVALDGDGQHDPSFIPELVERIEAGNDVCFTYRKRDKNMPWTRALGNWGLNRWMRLLFGKKPRDMLCGFIAYTADAYKKLRWETDRYGIETELTANCLKHKLKWAEVPISTIYLEGAQGVKFRDALAIAWHILRLRFR